MLGSKLIKKDILTESHIFPLFISTAHVLFIGHGATIQYGLYLQSDLIGSRAGTQTQDLRVCSRPLCHLSYHPLTCHNVKS